MRRHKNWLKAFCDLGAQSEAPKQFQFWAGVFTIGSALRRRVFIDQKFFQWIPNFYVVFVAPPGIAVKSTTLNLARRLLAGLDVTFGPQSITWQALTDALAESPDHSLCCIVSELGTFLDPKDPKMFDVLVDLWDGSARTWQHRTRTNAGKPIEDPVINVAAGTTPAWLRTHINPEVLDGGFSSRTIYVWAGRKSRLIPYPALAFREDEFERQLEGLKEDLERIAEIKGEFRLTKDAIEWGSQWYEKHWNTRPPAELSSYWARAQTHLHKLAIVLAAADAAAKPLTIEVRHLELAAHLLGEIEAGVRKVHTIVGTTEAGKRVAAVVEIVKAKPGISHKDLMAHFAHQMSAQELADTIKSAREAGFIEIKREGSVLTLWPLGEPFDQG